MICPLCFPPGRGAPHFFARVGIKVMDCAACDSISGNQQTGAVVACVLVIGVLLLVRFRGYSRANRKMLAQ